MDPSSTCDAKPETASISRCTSGSDSAVKPAAPVRCDGLPVRQPQLRALYGAVAVAVTAVPPTVAVPVTVAWPAASCVERTV